MRAIVTGQVGMEKRDYLDAVAALGAERGASVPLYHVGNRMYAEAPDVRRGRILDLPLSRLHAVRRSVFKDIITESAGKRDIIINTHATFRWRHGLFRAFDFDQATTLEPDLMICLVDNVEAVAHRLHTEHHIDATLKDLMVWREEEILATELLAQAVGCGERFYIIARGRETPTHQACYRLICHPKMRKVYPSFPMTHVTHLPDVLAEIDRFRLLLKKHFITFDPGDVDEKLLLLRAQDAAAAGQDTLTSPVLGADGQVVDAPLPVREVLDIAGDIDGQIYARDFKLIDQSDMIVSFVPELENNLPGLSSGVERELQHAFEHGKEVYVIWQPKRPPSPFVTETATRIFGHVQEAMAHFESAGMFAPTHLFDQ